MANIESTPRRDDYAPLLLGLMDAWDEMHSSEKNALLKQVLRRVALVKTDGAADIEIHPVWEPDPWAEAFAEAE
jgi:hypothetical protein